VMSIASCPWHFGLSSFNMSLSHAKRPRAFANKTALRRNFSDDNVYHALHETASSQCRRTMSAATVVSKRATIAEYITATTSIYSLVS
jgi:hypothetical protein